MFTKFFATALLVSLSAGAGAQVAINKNNLPVNDTAAMLEVRKAKLSKIRIKSESFNDTTQLEFSNRSGNTGTDFLITAKREAGLYFTTESDFASFRNDSLLTLLRTGNIGIGTKTPAYKLDVNGDINLTNRIRLNGSNGNAGQVLTSNGSADPTWTTISQAYDNTTRFCASATQGTSPTVDLTNYVTNYNTNPTDITVNATNGITINKTGLYHLDIGYTVSAVYTPSTSYVPVYNLTLEIGSIYQHLVHGSLFKNPFSSSNETYDLRGSSGGDFYLTAGARLVLSPLYYGSAVDRTSLNYRAQVRGYLISE